MNNIQDWAEEIILQELIYEKDTVWDFWKNFGMHIEPTEYDTNACKEHKKVLCLITRNEKSFSLPSKAKHK